MISRLRGSMESLLPDGCPFVIGGGLVRDALYGGRPNDIDIWLPSNITVPDVDAFCAHMVRRGYGADHGFQGQVIFRGPGATVEEVTEGIYGNADADAENYGDVHNHWVVEITPAPNAPQGSMGDHGHPRINIMRNMARWTGDAPSFFTEIMRNFDLDLCMYFVGWMPGQTNINTVIMPQHLHQSMLQNHRRGNTVAVTRINEVYWNQARMETTSTERIISRVRKMNEKYTIHLSENIDQIPIIPTAEIIAIPVLFTDILGCFNGSGGYGNNALPQRQNRVQQATLDLAMEAAQRDWIAYRDRLHQVGNMMPPNVTPMAFLRLNMN